MSQLLCHTARYVAYFLAFRGIEAVAKRAPGWYRNKRGPDIQSIQLQPFFIQLAALFIVSLSVVIYFEKTVIEENFLFLFAAYLITKLSEWQSPPPKSTSVRYGVGMACSFYEGYLNVVLSSDGANFPGFEANMRTFENKQHVFFPVKKLLIVLAKSLHCPPSLADFNKPNRPDLPYIETCQSLEDVVKSVTGVRNRVYRNSVQKIYRPGRRPVFLSAECASPLHTLYCVLKNRHLYEEISHIDKEEVVRDFALTLRSILAKSRECGHRAELVYFDDTDPEQNLASVLLDKIRELEPNFEDFV